MKEGHLAQPRTGCVCNATEIGTQLMEDAGLEQLLHTWEANGGVLGFPYSAD